jgi:hypothetical protein
VSGKLLQIHDFPERALHPQGQPVSQAVIAVHAVVAAHLRVCFILERIEDFLHGDHLLCCLVDSLPHNAICLVHKSINMGMYPGTYNDQPLCLGAL